MTHQPAESLSINHCTGKGEGGRGENALFTRTKALKFTRLMTLRFRQSSLFDSTKGRQNRSFPKCFCPGQRERGRESESGI